MMCADSREECFVEHHIVSMERRGLSRRAFVERVAVGGGAAVLAACGRDGGGEPSAPWVKDPTPFIRHPTNLETRLENLHGLLTPNDLFFVRNHAPTPRLDAATYRLRIEGDAVARPLELSYEDLLRLPSHTVVAYLECAGNWRSFYDKVLGQVASGGQWGTGGVSCASWSGVSLGTVLDLAGVRDDARDVNIVGLDDGAFERPMPLAKAVDSDTLLAYAMNGETLPADHGFPVRAMVPGWAGSNSIKWVDRIVVSSEKIWTKNNTTSYVLIGPEWPVDPADPAQGAEITTLNVKSALALPWPALLSSGRQRIRGFAYSPNGPIASVQWRADDGGWHEARLIGPALPRAWMRFELEWDATPGAHTVQTRARDARGFMQPNTVPFNEKGYLLNIALRHPVTVS